MDRFDGHIMIYVSDRGLDHRTACVDFSNDAITVVLAIGTYGFFSPFMGSIATAQIRAHIKMTLIVTRSDNYAGFVAAFVVTRSWVDRDHDALDSNYSTKCSESSGIQLI